MELVSKIRRIEIVRRNYMKARHLLMATLLLGTGWSTNVVYEYNTGHSIWRGIASEEVEINIDNVVSEASSLKEKVSNDQSEYERIKEVVSSSESSLDDLLKTQKTDLPLLKEELESDKAKLEKISQFIESSEGEISEELKGDLSSMKEILDGHDLLSLRSELFDKVGIALAEKSKSQNEKIDEISASICEQNKDLSSLTARIEELLADKEEVVEKVDEEDKDDKEKKDDKDKGDGKEKVAEEPKVDTAALMAALTQSFSMNPYSFFNAPQPMGLQSPSNPMGIDMNFFMLSQMLQNNNGFGPRPSINYAPVYNQQRSYFGMPSMRSTNYAGDAMMGNTFTMPQMMDPSMNQSQFLQGVNSGFNSENQAIFGRGANQGVEGFNFN